MIAAYVTQGRFTQGRFCPRILLSGHLPSLSRVNQQIVYALTGRVIDRVGDRGGNAHVVPLTVSVTDTEEAALASVVMGFFSLVSPDDIKIGVNFKAETLKHRNLAFQPAHGALTRIVGGIQILETSGPIAVSCVMRTLDFAPVRSVAGSTSRWKDLDLGAVEPIAEADVEHARH